MTTPRNKRPPLTDIPSAPRNLHLLLNWIFLTGLILLALNDHYLKAAFPGKLTGKLSDLAGLLIFPMFLAFVLPRHGKIMPLVTGLVFICWKSPWSTPLINLFNSIVPAKMQLYRTIDYTDLLALAVLPLSYYLIPNIDRYRITHLDRYHIPNVDRFRITHSPLNPVTDNTLSRLTDRRLTNSPLTRPGTGRPSHPKLMWLTRSKPIWLILPCSLVFMSTSMRYVDAHHPDGAVYVGADYTIKMNKEQLLDAMRKEGFQPLPDTSYHDTHPEDHLVLENVRFAGARDSIQSIQFVLYPRGDKTDIFVTYVKSTGDLRITDWHIMKMYTKYYRRLIKSRIVKHME